MTRPEALWALWHCIVGISAFGVFCAAIVDWFIKISLAKRIVLGSLYIFCGVAFSFSDLKFYQAFSVLEGLAAIIYLLPIIRDWPEKGQGAIVSKRELPGDGHPKKARILLVFRIWR